MQVILLSLSPWPSPRLSSCINLRSKITSSWPKEDNSQPQLAQPMSEQTLPQVPRGKASETDKLSYSEERMTWTPDTREQGVGVSPDFSR